MALEVTAVFGKVATPQLPILRLLPDRALECTALLPRGPEAHKNLIVERENEHL